MVGLVFWFILTLQCMPVSYFWQRVRLLLDPTSNVHGHCMSLDTVIDMAYVYSVTATLCDLSLGLLPIFLVWNLQMNRRAKAALAGILGMGCVYVLKGVCVFGSILTSNLVPAQPSSFAFPTCKITRIRISYVSFTSMAAWNYPPTQEARGKRHAQK